MREKSFKFNKTTLTLAIAGIVILLLGIVFIFASSSHSIFSNILFIISALLGVALMITAIYEILKAENKVFGNEPIKVYHAFAVNAIILCFCLFAGSRGLFTGRLFHALIDGALAALLIIYAGTFKNKSLLAYSIIAGVITAVISYFDIKYVTEILFVIFAVILFIQSIKDKKTEIKIYKNTALAVSAAVTLLSVIAMFCFKDIVHMYMHTIIIGAMFVIGLSVYGLISENKEKENVKISDEIKNNKNQDNKENGEDDKKIVKEDVKAIDEAKVSGQEDNVKNSSANPKNIMVIKAYQNLSYKELMNSPAHALKGVSEEDGKLLKEAFGIKTIGDFAENKFFGWAKEITKNTDK